MRPEKPWVALLALVSVLGDYVAMPFALVLIVLKLMGHLHSWWLAFSPLLVYAALYSIVAAVVMNVVARDVRRLTRRGAP